MSAGDDNAYKCLQIFMDNIELIGPEKDGNTLFNNIITEELRINYMKSGKIGVEYKRTITISWFYIRRVTVFEERDEYRVSISFLQTCDYSVCDLIVDRDMFKRLEGALNLMYVRLQAKWFGRSEKEARENIRILSMVEDSDFGAEEDAMRLESNSNSNESSGIIPSSIQSVEASPEIYAAASVDVSQRMDRSAYVVEDTPPATQHDPEDDIIEGTPVQALPTIPEKTYQVYEDVLVTQDSQDLTQIRVEENTPLTPDENVIIIKQSETESEAAISPLSASEGDYGGVVVPETEYEDTQSNCSEEELDHYVEKTLTNLKNIAAVSQEVQEVPKTPARIEVISVNEINERVQIVPNKANKYVYYDDIGLDLSKTRESCCTQEEAIELITNGEIVLVNEVVEESTSRVEEIPKTPELRRSRRNSVVVESPEIRPVRKSRRLSFVALNYENPAEETSKQTPGAEDIPKLRRSRRNSIVELNNNEVISEKDEIQEKRALRKSRNLDVNEAPINKEDPIPLKRSRRSSVSVEPEIQNDKLSGDSEESETLRRMLNEDVAESLYKMLGDLSQVISDSADEDEGATKPKVKDPKNRVLKELKDILSKMPNVEKPPQNNEVPTKKTIKTLLPKTSVADKENTPEKRKADEVKPKSKKQKLNGKALFEAETSSLSSPRNTRSRNKKSSIPEESKKRQADDESDSDEWTPKGVVKRRRMKKTVPIKDDTQTESFFSSYSRKTTITKTRTRVVTRSNRFCDEMNVQSEAEKQRRKPSSSTTRTSRETRKSHETRKNDDSDDEFLKTVTVRRRRNSTNVLPNNTLSQNSIPSMEPKESVIIQRHTQSTPSTPLRSSIPITPKRRLSHTPKFPQNDETLPFSLVANEEDFAKSFKENLSQNVNDDTSPESDNEADSDFVPSQTETQSLEKVAVENGHPKNNAIENGHLENGDPQSSQSSENIPATDLAKKPYKPFPIFTSESSTTINSSSENSPPKRFTKLPKYTATKINLRKKIQSPKKTNSKKGIENKLPPVVLSSLSSPDLDTPKFNELMVQPYLFQDPTCSQEHVDIHRREVKAKQLIEKLTKHFDRKLSEKVLYSLAYEVFMMSLKCIHCLEDVKKDLIRNFNKVYFYSLKHGTLKE